MMREAQSRIGEAVCNNRIEHFSLPLDFDFLELPLGMRLFLTHFNSGAYRNECEGVWQLGQETTGKVIALKGRTARWDRDGDSLPKSRSPIGNGRNLDPSH